MLHEKKIVFLLIAQTPSLFCSFSYDNPKAPEKIDIFIKNHGKKERTIEVKTALNLGYRDKYFYFISTKIKEKNEKMNATLISTHKGICESYTRDARLEKNFLLYDQFCPEYFYKTTMDHNYLKRIKAGQIDPRYCRKEKIDLSTTITYFLESNPLFPCANKTILLISKIKEEKKEYFYLKTSDIDKNNKPKPTQHIHKIPQEAINFIFTERLLLMTLNATHETFFTNQARIITAIMLQKCKCKLLLKDLSLQKQPKTICFKTTTEEIILGKKTEKIHKNESTVTVNYE